jgi:hypothetical protein
VKMEGGKKQKFPSPSWMVDGKAWQKWASLKRNTPGRKC